MEENNKIEIKKAKSLPIWFFTVMLFVFSAIFIVTGSFLLNKTNNDKQYFLQTSAVITSIDPHYEYDEDENGQETVTKTYNVYVKYSVDGKLYENVKIPSYNSSMEEGQTITITYDSRNPGKVVNNVKTTYIISIIFISIGAIAVVLMIFGAIKFVKKEKQETERINLLISTGVVKRCVINFISEEYKKGDYFECIVDGFEYWSPHIKHTPELYTGCTVNIYFEKEGYEERISKGKWHSNYYIDLNSVEEGTYQEPKKLI